MAQTTRQEVARQVASCHSEYDADRCTLVHPQTAEKEWEYMCTGDILKCVILLNRLPSKQDRSAYRAQLGKS
eukprot:6143280-Amphidinium_carterae.1